MTGFIVQVNTVTEPGGSTPQVEPRASNRRMVPPWPVLLALLLMATGCAKGSRPAGSPTRGGSPRSLPALELAVLSAVGGHLAYCDPDLYPVARGTALENAQARFTTIKSDRAAFEAIVQHEHLSVGQQFSPDELIAMSEDYKQMQAIDLKPAGSGYSFSLPVPQKGSDVGTWRLSGTVSRSGSVTIERREIGQRPSCPICLAAGVRIATPNGEIPVQEIRVGMAVWTTDFRGRRIASVVLKTGHMKAPLGHEVVRLSLADGRTVEASPGHPTADGRTVGDLEVGDRYDGSVVASATLVPYVGATWDLLPSGPTGTYVANGLPLGSTLSLIPVPPSVARVAIV